MATEGENLHVSRAQIQKAVEVLLSKVSQQAKNTTPLLPDAEAVHLQFVLKKIHPSQQTIKLKLPNGINKNKEVCLFVKDLDRTDREWQKSATHFKKSLKDQGIDCVSRIIPLKALKLEYKPFEAKRKLADNYEIFLADARIIRLLPSYLGKAFYGRKRNPIQVRLDSSDLKMEFESAISNSRCLSTGKGSVRMATVGDMDMSASELVQNISASAEQIAAAVPGGAVNIRSMYIKTDCSMAIPFYMSMGSANDVQLPEASKRKQAVTPDEVTTVEDGLVKVFPSGIVQVVDKETGRVKKSAKPVKRVGKGLKKPRKTATKKKVK